MRTLVFIFLLLMACSPSEKEQAVYNFEPGITDIKSLEKTGVLTARDSVPVLKQMLDSLGYERMQNLIKRIRRQIDLGDTPSSKTILDQYEKRLTFYESKIYDSTDLRWMNARLKRYEARPDSVLADKYNCVYLLGKQEIQKTFYFRNGKVIK